MSIIPDPTNPEGPAIADDGALAWPVFFAPIGTNPSERPAWKHLGWSRDSFTTTETREETTDGAE